MIRSSGPTLDGVIARYGAAIAVLRLTQAKRATFARDTPAGSIAQRRWPCRASRARSNGAGTGQWIVRWRRSAISIAHGKGALPLADPRCTLRASSRWAAVTTTASAAASVKDASSKIAGWA